jgi:hypothetical protein
MLTRKHSSLARILFENAAALQVQQHINSSSHLDVLHMNDVQQHF